MATTSSSEIERLRSELSALERKNATDGAERGPMTEDFVHYVLRTTWSHIPEIHMDDFDSWLKKGSTRQLVKARDDRLLARIAELEAEGADAESDDPEIGLRGFLVGMCRSQLSWTFAVPPGQRQNAENYQVIPT